MKYILLEALPGFTWWGGFAVTGIIGIVSWLFKSALKAEIDKRIEMQVEIDELHRKHDEMKDNMHKLQLEILNRINEVGIKIEGFRREISK